MELDESELDLVQQALRSYAKRPHLPIVQRRITAMQRRIQMFQTGMEA